MADRRLQGKVDFDIKDGIGIISFFHPAHNSLPGKVLAQLTLAIEKAGNNPEVKVIVLQSEGDRTFCAGASFDELVAIDSPESGKAFFMGFANVINACRKCPKFIIGRVQGKAVGGGVGVAAAVDYCLATKFASVKLSELAIGIGPFVVGPAVERKLGPAAMSQLAIDAQSWRSAEWARDRGLYASVCDTVVELDAEVARLAGQLASSNPEAMAALKTNFWAGTEHWDELLAERAAMSGRLVLSKFSREAIETFRGK